MFGSLQRKLELPTDSEALPGRDQPMVLPNRHFVHKPPDQATFSCRQSNRPVRAGLFLGCRKMFLDAGRCLHKCCGIRSR
ncbi:MAG: hypothetical protein Ct9H300mP16_06340 [Pseudomonadota bacterium]|nr:MAG: hypothetical protein Ct9H300mP16_06340 [Pseudomonadota bacterium]